MSLTAAEQLMIELVNRTRLDPLGEAERFGIDLNKSLPAGYLHTGARGVLAPESALELAATGHSQWMLATDIFSHTGVNGSDPSARALAAGYEGSGAGENISWTGTTGTANLNTMIVQQHGNLFNSAGHRANMLYDYYREIGLAQEAGGFTYNGTTYNASMVTQNFSTQSTVYYVTGVVYSDLDADRFYSIGEGVAGASFSGSGSAAQSAAAGGYALEVGQGAAVLVSGSVGAKAFTVAIEVAGVNAKLDVVGANTFYASADITLKTGIHNALLLGTAALDAKGNGAANTLEGNAAANTLTGLNGADVLRGMAGVDRLLGGGGNDELNGGADNDNLRGGLGDDTILGEDGRDLIYGEAGNDLMAGGAGQDFFYFNLAAGQDVITDFTTTDRLRFDDAIWGGGVTNGAGVVAQHASVVNGDVVIDMGGGNSVTLDGVSSLSGLSNLIQLF